MRGKAPEAPAGCCPAGITPAYAGKSCMQHTALGWCWDHPRLCGEKENACVTDAGNIGITPAYAGKSPAKHSVKRYERDHPRLCGEKRSMCGNASCGIGSPPPMRGKAGKLIRRQSGKGITPAYAGKSEVS